MARDLPEPTDDARRPIADSKSIARAPASSPPCCAAAAAHSRVEARRTAPYCDQERLGPLSRPTAISPVDDVPTPARQAPCRAAPACRVRALPEGREFQLRR